MSTDRSRLFVVTATGWVYSPRYLSKVVADDRFRVVGIASVPPHSGDDDRLGYAQEWVEAFGVRATLDHAAHSTAFAILDRLVRLTGQGRPLSAETLARHHGIRHRSVPNVNASALRKFAHERNPDVLLSVAAPGRFDPETLDVAETAINVHASLLPDHRGVMPAFWALRTGDETTGVTVHHMIEDLDAGAVITQGAVPIEPNDALHDLNTRLAETGATVLLDALVELREGTATTMPVDPDAGSYHSLPERADVRAFRQAGHSLY